MIRRGRDDWDRQFGLNRLLTDQQYADMMAGRWDADDVPAVDPRETVPPDAADPLPIALGIVVGFLLGFIASALLLTS